VTAPGADATFDHAGARPVGVVEKDFAVIENLGDCSDVAVAHRTEARHRHDGANAWFMPAAITAFGLVPPCVSIAAQVQAGNFPSERNALQGTGGRECRRDQGCKESDDGDNDDQLHQCESATKSSVQRSPPGQET
jgi:hypothetical protein